MKELRELIRDLREDHDLKQKAVAKHLNIAQQTYSNYENGRRAIPVCIVPELARLYQVSTDYLLGMDTDYFGRMHLDKFFLKDITMYEVMYDIQKLKPQGRKELLRYLQYLKSIEAHEAARKRT